MRRSWVLSLLWPRKHIILLAAGASLLGGVTVIFVAPPRYMATARVTMDYVKPDPYTGRYMSSKNLEAYIISQAQMITDYQVTIPAVEAMGLLDNPEIADAYASRPPDEQRLGYPQWVASRFMGGADASIVPDSNILQVEFRGTSPTLALSAVEALRQAYIEENVDLRRQSAAGKAEALASRAAELRLNIARVEKIKTEYERANGVSLTNATTDPDSLTLRRLATSVDDVVPVQPVRTSATAEKLQEVESQIAQLSTSLGPNNPRLLALRRMRDVLSTQVAAERAAASSIGGQMTARAASRGRLIEEQKVKVLRDREKILQLRLYQDEINRDTKEANDALQEVVALRQMANATIATVTSVGEAKVQPKPIFPNIPLILAGSGGMGLVLGVLLTLLIELLRRRVRSVRDLELAAQMPILGVVPLAARPKRPRRFARPPRVAKAPRGKRSKPVAA